MDEAQKFPAGNFSHALQIVAFAMTGMRSRAANGLHRPCARFTGSLGQTLRVKSPVREFGRRVFLLGARRPQGRPLAAASKSWAPTSKSSPRGTFDADLPAKAKANPNGDQSNRAASPVLRSASL